MIFAITRDPNALSARLTSGELDAAEITVPAMAKTLMTKPQFTATILPGFDYTAADQITADIRKSVDEAGAFTAKAATRTVQAASGAPVVRDVPIYQVDAMVRRSAALQSTREGREERGGRA